MLEDNDGPPLPRENEICDNVTSIETAPENIMDFDSSDDDNNVSQSIRVKKRLQYLTDSESDHDHINESNNKTTTDIIKRTFSSSESISECVLENDTCNHLQIYESRTEDRKKKLRDKFKKLKSPKANKSLKIELISSSPTQSQILNETDCQSSDQEISCLKIKKVKKRSTVSSICDPDTSDEDDANNSKLSKKKSRATESTSHKQVRMSAKEAMVNMHKIKSESNRMLREKDVSLPYHKPKALSLQDIMSRRKPALTNDGKALPIKMNKEQLQQYVKFLEERQKEIIELCKSDTEEEEIPEMEINKEQYTKSTITNGDDNAQENVKENNTSNIENNYLTDPPLNDIYTSMARTVKTSENILNEGTLENNLNNHTEIRSEHDNHIDPVVELPEADLSNDNSEMDCEKNTLDSNKDNGIIHSDTETNSNGDTVNDSDIVIEEIVNKVPKSTIDVCDNFSDDEFNIENIDKIIEEAEIINDTLQNVANKFNSTIERTQINIKPMLAGSPGMFIDLENETSLGQKKNSGIELLKERFEYFSNLKSAEELEKNRETRYKPGTQHLKLKHELEEQIAEQRSLEWEKRLEDEKQQKAEMNNELSDEDEIDKIEAKLEEKETQIENIESESSELEENDIIMNDKPKMRNQLIDDEAEESDEEPDGVEDENSGKSIINDNDVDADGEDCSDNDESSEDSSESEDEVQQKEKKGRILKAFEDSDDEYSKDDKQILQTETCKSKRTLEIVAPTINKNADTPKTQDEDIQLAQVNKSLSEDIFATQDSEVSKNVSDQNKGNELLTSPDLGSQTFSILDSTTNNNKINLDLSSSEKLSVPSKTQSINDNNFDLVSKICGGFSQSLIDPDCPPSQLPPSQQIGDDIAALCTGKFYDNPFVSPHEGDSPNNEVNSNNIVNNRDEDGNTENVGNINLEKSFNSDKENIFDKENTSKLEEKKADNGSILKSILDELNEPDFETQKQNKYFWSKECDQNTQLKKKFVIDSDDELYNESNEVRPKKKLKKRKAEKRALKISDDEDEESEKELEEVESEIEEEPETMVEYDSEENEIEVKTKSSKGKKMGEFFENEAEMTSEDEWVGSGDEDEAGLDRMEREAGDDDVFQQGALQRELGQIHMREVMDQDKREVRLIQELLFEDGDLGDGHRQRKFRWKTDADGGEETGIGVDDMADTQEEEFESEEQWRKQRHERELFLRQMQEKSEDNILNTSINRTTIIKANLSSRTMSSLISETKSPVAEKEPPVNMEKKAKDIPSPKKPFALFQQSYHGSLLTRGRGALARLAALATPLAADDDAPKLTASASSRNFVFAARAPADEEPKVTKRKAENNISTPKLIKKMKTEETQKYLKNSLFDHFKT